MSDNRIAALVAECEAKAREHPDLADRYDNPAVRRSIANSVAIGRVCGLGAAYGALIRTAHDWWPTKGRAGNPHASAANVHRWAPHAAARTADVADAVATFIADSGVDLLDDGATVTAWRAYAALLREPPAEAAP
jgi:hypothetical protein